MKKLLATSLFLLSGTVVQAEQYKFVNPDQSPLADVCIAAVESREAALDAAAEAGLNSSQLSALVCNGMSLESFASKYRQHVELAPQTVFTLSPGDRTPETQLCIAAVTSKDEYQALKSEHFEERTNPEEDILCNNLPLKTFVRKYRNQAYTASLQ